MYFDLRDYLKKWRAGADTVYTSGRSAFYSFINADNDRGKGLATEQARIRHQAEDFEAKIKDLPFEIVSNSLSAALTPLHPTGVDKEGKAVSAHRILRF